MNAEKTPPRPGRERSLQTKKYLSHYPVSSLRQAKALSKESAWEILDVIRAAGVQGASARDVTEILDIPMSDVYASLKELTEIGCIVQLPRRVKPKTERKRLYISEKTTLKKYDIDEKLATVTKNLYGRGEELESLRVSLFGVLAMFHDDLRGRGLKEMLPSAGPEWFCDNCRANHEAVEFFHAVAIAILRILMDESPQFKEFLGRLGYLKGFQPAQAKMKVLPKLSQ